MDKPFGKLGPSSSSSCSTLSPSSIIIAPQIITSLPFLLWHYSKLLKSIICYCKRSSRVKTLLAFNQNPYHLMSGTPPAWHVSIGLVFPIAIFHLGQVTCRYPARPEEFPSLVTKGFGCILNTFSMSPWCEQQRKWTRWNFL